MADETEVALKVDVADHASAALAKLADAIGKVTAAEKKMADETARMTREREKLEISKRDYRNEVEAEREARRVKPTAATRFRDAATGARDLAGGGGMTGLVGKAGAVGAGIQAGVQAVDAAMVKSANAINILNSGIHTTAQKRDAILSEIVPLYGSFKKLREAVDGTTERIAASARRLELALAVGQAEFHGYQAMRAVGAEYQGAAATTRAFGIVGATPGTPTFDRSTALGARRTEEQGAVQSALDARHMAEINRVATQQALTTQSVYTGVRRASMRGAAKSYYEQSGATRGLLRAEDAGGPRNKAGIREALDKQEELGQAAGHEIAKVEQELTRLSEMQKKAIEAESAARKANIDVMRGELAIQEQREQRMAGYAQKLGAMNQADFEYAKQIAQVVNEGDLKDLPQEFADVAAQVAPEMVAKKRERLGAERAGEVAQQFPGIDDSVISDFRKSTLEEVRAQVDKVRADIKVEINLDAKAMAEDLENRLEPILRDLVEVQDRKIALVAAELRRTQISKAQAEK